MRISRALLSMLPLVVLCSEVNAQPNMVVNGSFETGDFSGWTVSGNVSIQPGGSHGAMSAQFNDSDYAPNAVLTQAVATVQGQRYALELDYGVITFRGSTQRLLVEVIGSHGTLVSQQITGPSPSGVKTFTRFAFDFVADSSSVLLRLTDVPSNVTTSTDGELDHIQVRAITSDVVANGSFETGDFSGWTFSGNCQVISGGTDGEKNAAFNGGDMTPNAVLSQSISTNPGQQYVLEFDYGVHSSFGTIQGVLVQVVGGSGILVSKVFVAPTSGIPPSFSRFGLDFTADGSSVLLVFSDLPGNQTIAADGELDRVQIHAAGLLGVGDEASSSGKSFLRPPVPNPCAGRCNLSYSIARGGRIQLGVYDVSGRLVRSLVDGERRAGDGTVVWDGTDASGSRPKAGVYFVRLVGPGVRMIQRVAMLR